VFIGSGTAIAFKYAKIDDPATYYEGKTIRVAGRVTLYQERPEIAIASPEQIQIVEKPIVPSRASRPGVRAAPATAPGPRSARQFRDRT